MNWLINQLLLWLKGISIEQWQLALTTVISLAKKDMTNQQRWEAAKQALGLQDVLSDKANFLIELALQYAKKKGWVS